MKRIFGAKTRLLVSVLALVCILAVGGTLALLYASDGSLTNRFTLAQVDTEIQETDSEGNKTVTIVNTGASDAYVRARILVSGLPEEKVQVVSEATLPREEDRDPDALYLVMNHLNSNEWQQLAGAGKSDWYYYCQVLPSGATGNETSSLLSKVVFGKNLEEKLDSITVTITHESVLAQPADKNDPAGIKGVFDAANTATTPTT